MRKHGLKLFRISKHSKANIACLIVAPYLKQYIVTGECFYFNGQFAFAAPLILLATNCHMKGDIIHLILLGNH
jgi:hypothetical protein